MFAAFSFEIQGGTMPKMEITLNGIANGGTVSLMEIVPIYAGFVSIVTTQGESAEVVLNRLADEVCGSDLFNWGRPLKPRPQFVKVTGNTLTLPSVGFRYCFSGTDKGFAIPKPMLSVSGTYDAEKQQVSLYWIIPGEQYDTIISGPEALSPHATNCVYEVKPSERRIFSAPWVIGKRGEAYSPPAGVAISTNAQEELDTFPFYMGIAPNWSSWSEGTNAAAFNCEQGIKPDVDMRVRGDSWDKPFYQILKTTKAGVQGGVWRRFLGLKPGHTYKVEVRLNTLQMDACTNEWAFSFHAAYDYPSGQGLTTNQLAGVAALPDGSKGPAAGRVVLYGPGVTTKGQWEKRSTDKAGPGLEIKNITLPEKVTSITVWLRHSGANSTGVGMDWIRLEDVTGSR
ncbi:MAG TPA: hypothetical protein PLT00_08080 [Verrucomicrobiota bacterium]|jgi:hypothetical protein|nr:hypothetical protein [Verrucomicrobiota bacterium]HQB16653.1 hypothetical protein [Verrucomicrobiota bacterium]